MTSVNPDESPLEESTTTPNFSELYVTGTIGPRHLAASGDYVIATILALVVGAQSPDDDRLLLFGILTAVWLAYYLVTETLFSTTPCKYLAGLVVLQLNGQRMTVLQAFVRTLFRLLEVNPILLGGLPAALSIVFSRRRQRIGDKVAGTVVVSWKQMKRRSM